jgi:hypothetical protein
MKIEATGWPRWSRMAKTGHEPQAVVKRPVGRDTKILPMPPECKLGGTSSLIDQSQLILKLTLLISLTAALVVHVTRILAVVVAGPLTTQLKVPLVLAVLITEAAIVSV